MPFASPRTLAGSVLLTLLVIVLAVAYTRRFRSPPFAYNFATSRISEWKAYGGTWFIKDGILTNSSDERGAKLLIGSPSWVNYQVDADVELLGAGDAGLIARVTDEEDGVDAYSGYYLGLRTLDNSLALGRADHGWIEYPSLSLRDGVKPLQWYHLTLAVYDCDLYGSARAALTGKSQTLYKHDAGCPHHGRIGLRSYSSGGAWRNVQVKELLRPPEISDADQQVRPLATRNVPSTSVFSTSEVRLPIGMAVHAEDSLKAHTRDLTPIIPIGDLRWVHKGKSSAHIRGVVIGTSPDLVIEDPSGGLSVRMIRNPTPLKLGDEVDVNGTLLLHDQILTLDDAHVTVLWPGTPLPPVSITAAQAASGNYDSRFVEVEGTVNRLEHQPGTGVSMQLSSGYQSFTAYFPQGFGDSGRKPPEVGSRLRVRGICTISERYTHNAEPFAVVVSPGEDILLVSGPPWWTVRHLFLVFVGTLLFLLIMYAIRLRVAHEKFRAVIDERERLAHEMHDTLAQSIAGIGFQLGAIRNHLPSSNPKVHQQLELATQMVRHIHEEARRSISTLRPESLQDIGLAKALEESAMRMVDGGSLQVRSSLTGEEYSIPLRVKDTLFRIGYEAIANAVRHAAPTCITINVAFHREMVCLTVSDDGLGYEPSDVAGGFGIKGMKKRADSLSATFAIQTTSTGTKVTVRAPVSNHSSWLARCRSHFIGNQVWRFHARSK